MHLHYRELLCTGAGTTRLWLLTVAETPAPTVVEHSLPPPPTASVDVGGRTAYASPRISPMFGIGSRLVSTPRGEAWRVGRRWSRRELPRWRKARIGKPGDPKAFLSIPDVGDADDIGTAILAALAAIVFVFVVITLLLFGLELILLSLAIAAGMFARTLLGRPWVVQAQPFDPAEEPLSWHATSWRCSSRLIDEISEALRAGRDPGTVGDFSSAKATAR